MDSPSDQFPEIPLNSRRICLGFRDMDERVNYHRVVFINAGLETPLETVSERFVLSAKLLSGMTIEQLREAMNGTNLKIYYEP